MTSNNGSFERLIDVVEGRVDGAEAECVLAAVAADPAVAATYGWLSGFVALSQRTTLEAPPASTRVALDATLPPRSGLVDEVGKLVNYVGRLVRDVPMGHTFAGARGAAVGVGRQLFFDAGGGDDLVVQLQLGADPMMVSGQILAADPTRQVLLVSEHLTIEIMADEFGEFAAHVAPTSYLRLELFGDSGHTSVDLTPYLELAIASLDAQVPVV